MPWEVVVCRAFLACEVPCHGVGGATDVGGVCPGQWSGDAVGSLLRSGLRLQLGPSVVRATPVCTHHPRSVSLHTSHTHTHPGAFWTARLRVPGTIPDANAPVRTHRPGGQTVCPAACPSPIPIPALRPSAYEGGKGGLSATEPPPLPHAQNHCYQ